MNLNSFLKEFADNYYSNADSFYERFISELNYRFDTLSYEDVLQCGIRLCQLSYFSYAISVFDNLMQIFSERDIIEGVISCSINKGIAFHMQGNIDKSIKQYQDAILLAETHQKYHMLPNVYGNLSIYYDSVSEFDLSIMYANKALKLLQNDAAGKISCFIVLGSASKNKGEFFLSIEYYTKAMEISKELGDKGSESNCLSNLSKVFELTGKYQKALELNERAICIKQEINDQYGLSNCFIYNGSIYLELAEYEKAKDYLDKSLEIKIKIGDKKGEALCLENLGVLNSKIENYIKGIDFFKQALKLRQKEHNSKRINFCYQFIISCYKLLGDAENAKMYQEEKKIINNQTDILDVFSENINNGIAARKKGEYSTAIEFFKQSLSYAIEFGWKDKIIKSKLNLGNVYQNLGRSDDAIKEYKEVMQICIELNDKTTTAICYQNIGCSFLSLKNLEKALYYTEKSIELFDNDKNKLEVSRSLTNIGSIYSAEDPKKALTYLLQSLDIKLNINDKEGLANCYINIGSAYYSLNDFNNSIKYSFLALDIAKELKMLEVQKIACLNLGKAYNRIHENEKSFTYLKLAVSLINQIVDNLHYQEDIISYLSNNSIYFQYIIPQCIEYNKFNEAFSFLENNKSLSLIRLLSHKIINKPESNNNELENIVARENIILEKIIDLETKNIQYSNIGNPNELSSLNIQLKLVRDKIKHIDYEYYLRKTGGSLGFEEIHKYTINQNKNVVILEFYSSSDTTFIFIISSREKNIQIEKVNISLENIIRFVDIYNKEIEMKMPDDYWLELSVLLHPVKKYLDENDIVYIIPWGILHLIPFHALMLDNERFIEKHITVYSPSASLLTYLPANKITQYKTCTSFGVDTIGNVKDMVEEGAKSLSSLFESNLFIGDNAIKSNLINGISTDILSFLCHGYFNFEDPQLSGLNLFDTNLTANDVFQMKFNVDLVSLNACTSGFNKINYSDDCVGLTRAFLYAGAASVTNCLRPVDALVTTEFMFDFFEQLKIGILKAEAFRNTTLKIMKKYPHPYYWSPFTLVGKWY